MQSTEYIIQLARERALFSFSALIRPVVQDALKSITTTLAATRSLEDQRWLWLAEKFLKQDADLLRKRFEAVYKEYLERAMQTMYRDLRLRLNQISADDLTLIDDATVNREMQVDRLLLRLKDSDDENLSRINIIIAQLHGNTEVKERENPFRPYLIARSLHQVLTELAPDDQVVKILNEHLSNALAAHLSTYYEAIRTVFESRGIRARLLAQPGRLVRFQRYAGGSFLDGEDQLRDSAPANAGLRNLLGAMPPHGDAGAPAEATDGQPSVRDLQDFMNRIFARSREYDGEAGFGPARDAQALHLQDQDAFSEPALRPASQELLARVNQMQLAAAQGDPASPANPLQYELFEAAEPADQEARTERLTIDVVGMLFQYLLEDEQIPQELRVQIGRLQIPFLKAAMLSPDVLQQAEHPARMLLNRMNSVAIGVDPDTPDGRQLGAEMERIVEKVLHEFKDDPAVFGTCLAELEQFLQKRMGASHRDIAPWIEEAEDSGERLGATVVSLRRFLQPLIVDARAFRFVCDVWSKVMCQEAFGGAAGGATGCRDLLPELLWSVQDKRNPDERSALIRLLPGLVKRLKDGMATIRLSEAECRQAMDDLVALHTEVLRPNNAAPVRRLLALEDLRRYFTHFTIGCDCHPPALASEPALAAPDSAHDELPTLDALELHAAALESALARHGIAGNVEPVRQTLPAFESDEEWMAQMQLGICVERWADDTFQVAHLAWISRTRSLFLFRDRQSDRPFVYSAAALLKALREGSVRLAEYAPAFERAVDALLSDAAALSLTPPKDAAPFA